MAQCSFFFMWSFHIMSVAKSTQTGFWFRDIRHVHKPKANIPVCGVCPKILTFTSVSWSSLERFIKPQPKFQHVSCAEGYRQLSAHLKASLCQTKHWMKLRVMPSYSGKTCAKQPCFPAQTNKCKECLTDPPSGSARHQPPVMCNCVRRYLSTARS